MPFMYPQIQFKAGFFGTFHFISIILCYGHFIHALDMPGDAECVSGMSQLGMTPGREHASSGDESVCTGRNSAAVTLCDNP